MNDIAALLRRRPALLFGQAGIDHRSAQVLADVQRCIGLTGFRGLRFRSFRPTRNGCACIDNRTTVKEML